MNLQDMPLYQALSQRSIKPLYQQFTTPQGRQDMINRAGQQFQPMNLMPMGSMESNMYKPLESYLAEKSGVTMRQLAKQALDRSHIKSAELDMQEYANKLSRNAKDAAMKVTNNRKLQSFNRATSNFSPENLINNYINK